MKVIRVPSLSSPLSSLPLHHQHLRGLCIIIIATIFKNILASLSLLCFFNIHFCHYNHLTQHCCPQSSPGVSQSTTVTSLPVTTTFNINSVTCIFFVTISSIRSVISIFDYFQFHILYKVLIYWKTVKVSENHD